MKSILKLLMLFLLVAVAGIDLCDNKYLIFHCIACQNNPPFPKNLLSK